ncbi:hypothetical protein C7271_03610 [filamentous cyanobacterium CCP5]|nr:hypothetical protein C7271_03610 [filamentous cyanobacterium CCP5]
MKNIIWILRYIKRKGLSKNYYEDWKNYLNAWEKFWADFERYQQLADNNQGLNLSNLYPCIGDNTSETPIEPIYFHQDTWAFEHITKQKPSQHFDVGSNHKFVAFLSKIIPVTMVDIRPLALSLNTLNFKEGSILDLPFSDESIESLSSLCVVEHIGLGRYGDPLDPNGSEKAISELKRVLKPGGDLYISVPVDDCNKTFFNAHRAFSVDYLEKKFFPLETVEAKYIYGDYLVDNKRPGFGIGLFHFKKTSKVLEEENGHS